MKQGVKDVSELLREGDPIRREPALSPAEVERMRRRIVAASPPISQTVWWPRPILLGTAVALTLTTGAAVGTLLWEPEAIVSPPARTEAVERRQIQFETPGGTRVIWTLSSDFGL